MPQRAANPRCLPANLPRGLDPRRAEQPLGRRDGQADDVRVAPADALDERVAVLNAVPARLSLPQPRGDVPVDLAGL
jgi:hypothetical protein